MKEKLMRNMGYLIAILDVALYMLLSWVSIEGLRVNIIEIIVNGAMLFVGSIIANEALMKQGILNGRNSEEYKDTLKAHITEKNKIYPKLNNLQMWLDADYLKLLKMGRSVYTNSAGYDYEKVFMADGKINTDFFVEKPIKNGKWKLWEKLFSPEWKLYREKIKFIKKAKKYKITHLKVSDLLDVEADKDPNNFGETEKQYTSKRSSLNVVSKLVFSIMLQSVSLVFFGFNMQALLTQLLNIFFVLIFALFSMFSAYSFMVKTHRETVIKKINKMEEFDNTNESLIKELNKKEVQKNADDTKVSICTKSNMVQEIHGQSTTGQENNICSN